MGTSEQKQQTIKEFQTSKQDTGSSVVQIGLLTNRITELTEHLKQNKKDFMARRGLLQAVGKRKRHLSYLAERDGKAYLSIVKKLGIRR